MKKLLFTLFILTASCLMLLTACTECEVCSFGDWETVTEATCTAEGEKVRVCSECQKEDRQPIEMKDHDLSLKETTLAATCTTEGKETWGCANCDYTEERTVKATGHKETKTVTAEATCSKQGTAVYTCSVCNNIREEVIQTTRHNYKAPTCKKPATCADCGATSGSTAPHNYTEATCKKPATCKDCGATTGSKTNDHDFAEATCSKPKTCTVCGKTEGSKKDHYFSYGNAKCKNCGYAPSINLQATTVPKTITYYGYNKVKESACNITNISAEAYSYDSSTNEIDYNIYLTGTCTYHKNGSGQSSSMKIGWKLYDSDGVVVKSGTEYTESVAPGEGFRAEITFYDLTPGKTYKLVLLDVN